MLLPLDAGSAAGLFHPVKAVTMSPPIDEVGLAITVHVVADDGKSCFAEIPISVPLQLVGVGVDVLELAVRGENVDLAVSIDVRHSNPVPVLIVSAGLMHLRLGA